MKSNNKAARNLIRTPKFSMIKAQATIVGRMIIKDLFRENGGIYLNRRI